jgi:DNA helicase-2/ATP-dependent DNA helicase PcrA
MITAYEDLLRKRGLIDFDDMMLLGLNLVERNEWVRRTLQARFPILAVDEYQDLGVPLHRIVLSLCFVGGVRLFAVGDEDQSIYGFTGAQPDLLVQLSKRPGVETIRLPFNYRSGKTIVNASLVALGQERGYTAKSEHQSTIDFYECPQGLEEQAHRICTEIIPAAIARRKGRTYGDIAVLYVDRNDGDVIEAAAKAANIKFIRTDKGAPYRKTTMIRWLEDCSAWCAGGWQSGQPRLSSLIRTWLTLNPSRTADDQRTELRCDLVRFLSGHRGADTPLSTWLADFDAACLRQTLTRETTLSEEAEEVGRLTAACRKGGKLDAFTVASFGKQGGAPDHLNLITLHSAKGQEFDVVVMMGMDQGKLPSWAAKDDEQKREPRRLFYVGLTRARHEVHMTYSGFTKDKYNRRHENGPSEFLIEVADRLAEIEGEWAVCNGWIGSPAVEGAALQELPRCTAAHSGVEPFTHLAARRKRTAQGIDRANAAPRLYNAHSRKHRLSARFLLAHSSFPLTVPGSPAVLISITKLGSRYERGSPHGRSCDVSNSHHL